MNYASTGKEYKELEITARVPRLLIVGSKGRMVASKDTRRPAKTRRTVE